MDEIILINRYLNAYIKPILDSDKHSVLTSLDEVVKKILLIDSKKPFLSNDFISKGSKISLIQKLLPKDNPRLSNFIILLCRKNRINFLEKFPTAINYLKAEYETKKQTDIYTNSDLSTDEKKSIVSLIEKKMNISIEPNYKIDEKLLGGFKALIGQTQIDCSLRNVLDKYQRKVLNVN